MARHAGLLSLCVLFPLAGCGLLLDGSFPVEPRQDAAALRDVAADREAPPFDATDGMDTASDIPSDTASDIPSDTASDIPSDTASDIPSDTASDIPSDTASDIPSDTVSEVSVDVSDERDVTIECRSVLHLVAPLSGAILATGTQSLEWIDTPCGGPYELQVATDRALTRRLPRAGATGLRGTAVMLEDLSPGVYFWKVLREGRGALGASAVGEFRVLPHTRSDDRRVSRASLGLMPDFTGDGVSDLVVGISGGTGTGRVVWMEGRVGFATEPSSIRRGEVLGSDIPGLSAVSVSTFGARVSALGDANSDGFPDVLVGTRGEHSVILSGDAMLGLSARLALVITLPVALTALMNEVPAVTAAGDFNRDGYGDIAIGHGSPDVARVQIFSTATRSVFAELSAAALPGHFGRSLAPLGDANGDGFADLLVGAPNTSGISGNGQRWLVTGASSPAGVTVTRVPLVSPGASVVAGSFVAGAGDLNADGLGDWLWTQNRQIAVESLSGLSFTSLSQATIAPPDGLFIAQSAGDQNRDERSEIIGYTQGTNARTLQFLSDRGGTLVQSTVALEGGNLRAVGTPGDLDGDGADNPVALVSGPEARSSTAWVFINTAGTLSPRAIALTVSTERMSLATAY